MFLPKNSLGRKWVKIGLDLSKNLPKTARPPRLSSRCRAGLGQKWVKVIKTICFSDLPAARLPDVGQGWRAGNAHQIQALSLQACPACPVEPGTLRVFNRDSSRRWYRGYQRPPNPFANIPMSSSAFPHDTVKTILRRTDKLDQSLPF